MLSQGGVDDVLSGRPRVPSIVSTELDSVQKQLEQAAHELAGFDERKELLMQREYQCTGCARLPPSPKPRPAQHGVLLRRRPGFVQLRTVRASPPARPALYGVFLDDLS